MSDSNKSTTTTASGGISFLGALFITFLVLKLCKVINWSWWWITAPLWGPIAIALAIGVIYLIVAIISAIAGRDEKADRSKSISYKEYHAQLDMEKEEEQK